MARLRLLCVLLVLTAALPPSVAAEANEAPLVDAGLDQTVERGTVVYLDGGGSLDPDGKIVEYEWRIETPRGETMRPADPAAERTSFVAGEPGRYRATLTVSDEDGRSRSDTLYVDVVSAPRSGESSDGQNQQAPGDAGGSQDDTGGSQIVQPPPQMDGGSSGPIQRAPNQAPFGLISGPSTVRAGASGHYVLSASDRDGRVVDFWWEQPSELSIQGRTLEAHSTGMTYDFDVDPGSTVTLPVIVTDDEGAQSTITKEVEVTNNLPQVTLVGPQTVENGSVHQFEAVASDPDGPIVSYSWDTDSPVVEKIDTAGLTTGDSSPEAGDYMQLFRFKEIPKGDATSPISVSVSDKDGGEMTDEQLVTVSLPSRTTTDNPIENPKPTLTEFTGSTTIGDEYAFRNSGFGNPGRIEFFAKAEDNNATLVYEWSFGDKGTARTVSSGNDSSSNVAFVFQSSEARTLTIPITVVVKDPSGKSTQQTKNIILKPGGVQYSKGASINVQSTSEGIIQGQVTLSNRQGYDPSKVTLFFGDGSNKRFAYTLDGQRDQKIFSFHHRYRVGGEYTLFIYDGNKNGKSYGYTTVNIDSQNYSIWNYEQRVTKTFSTIARERPGEDWKRAGVDHYDSELEETRTTTTQLVDGRSVLSPGKGWTRTGTTVEYHTETRTKRAVKSPGSEWSISERNVGEKQVFDGWQSATVPDKRFAPSSWKFVGRTAKTKTTTRRRESADRPDGTGWTRDGATGDHVRSGTDYHWVSTTYLAHSSWNYVRSDRYVDYYRTETDCVRYFDRWGFRTCAERRTTREPVYDYRYLYSSPEYETVYRWERTVKTTVYEYEYRFETYRTENVHEYTKQVRVGEQYATWEKQIFKEIPVYRWERTEERWVGRTSFSEPSGPDVRAVSKDTKSCGQATEQEDSPYCE